MFNDAVEFRRVQKTPPVWKVFFNRKHVAEMKLSEDSIYIAKLHSGSEVIADDRKEMAARITRAIQRDD